MPSLVRVRIRLRTQFPTSAKIRSRLGRGSKVSSEELLKDQRLAVSPYRNSWTMIVKRALTAKIGPLGFSAIRRTRSSELNNSALAREIKSNGTAAKSQYTTKIAVRLIAKIRLIKVTNPTLLGSYKDMMSIKIAAPADVSAVTITGAAARRSNIRNCPAPCNVQATILKPIIAAMIQIPIWIPNGVTIFFENKRSGATSQYVKDKFETVTSAITDKVRRY